MATLDDRTYSSNFRGLLANAEVSLAIIGIGIVLFESLRRIRRNTIRKIRTVPSDNAEDWFMNGYLYQARCYVAHNPSFRLSDWPLAWIGQVIPLKEKWYVDRIGLDGAVYVRLLRGTWFFTMSQALTVLPVLLTIHLVHSPPQYLKTDIERASLSALVADDSNKHLLWVHVVMSWWMTIAWMLALIFIGRGALHLRRYHLSNLKGEERQKLEDAQIAPLVQPQTVVPGGGLVSTAQRAEVDLPPAENHRGWRHRSIVVTNIPNDMRTESTLISYFTEELKKRIQHPQAPSNSPANSVSNSPTASYPPQAKLPHQPSPPSPVSRSKTSQGEGKPLITAVVLIRRTLELHQVHRKREEVLHLLERAHVYLAKRALRETKSRIERIEKQKVKRLKQKESTDSQDEKHRPAEAEDDDQLIATLRPFLPNYENEPNDRVIWEALGTLPREVLDEFQPLYQLRHLFKGQSVPQIDYFLAKYNLLTALLDDLRGSPVDTYSPGPTAFITFETASLARKAARYLKWHPERSWACKVRMAPDVRDIEWDKVVKMSFRGDVLRSFVIGAGVWLFIIFWVIPVSLLLSLFSLDNIASVLPPLQNWLGDNPRSKALLSSLVPVVLLAVLTFLVPTLIIQFSHRGQHFYTVSKLHHAVLCRYHSFLITNVIIVFSLGAGVVESVFSDPSRVLDPKSILDRVAAAFPKGATFFIGWQIVVAGIHNFFELMLLGFPWINHISVATAKTPRKRLELALPRHINIYYVLPNQISVLAVLFVFAILNPLVIAFNAIYFTFALIVFKRSFGFYYFVRHYQLDGKMIYIRYFRFSLDCLMVGQIVVIALLWVSRAPTYGAACIPLPILTAFFKLLGTRMFQAYSLALDVKEAEIVCKTRRKARQVIEEISIPLAPAFLSKVGSLGNLTWRLKVHMDTIFVEEHQSTIGTEPSGKVATEPPWWQFWKTHSVKKVLRRSNIYAESTPILCRASSSLSDISIDSDSEDAVPPKKHALAEPKVSTAPDSLVPTDAATFADALWRPHPPLVRDDRSNYSALYQNPFLTEPLCRHLWLPRHPLGPIDLNDSVDWFGKALVSSTGGNGVLGVPDEDEATVRATVEAMRARSISVSVAQDQSLEGHKNRRKSNASSPAAFSMARRTPSNQSLAYQRLQGNERIQIAEVIKNRLDDGERAENAGLALRISPPPPPPPAAEEEASETFQNERLRSYTLQSAGSQSSRGRSPSVAFSTAARSDQSEQGQDSYLRPEPSPLQVQRVESSPLHSPASLGSSPGRRPSFLVRSPTRLQSGSFIAKDDRRVSVSQQEALREEIMSELSTELDQRDQEIDSEERRVSRAKSVLGRLVYR